MPPEPTDPRPPPGKAGRQARTAAETRGRPPRLLGAAKPGVTAPSGVSGDTVAEPAGEARPDDLPVVPDRLKIPKAERAAYDNGLAAGTNGWGEKPPRRFQPGQRLAHLLPYHRAGCRAAAAEAASEAREPPGV